MSFFKDTTNSDGVTTAATVKHWWSTLKCWRALRHSPNGMERSLANFTMAFSGICLLVGFLIGALI